MRDDATTGQTPRDTGDVLPAGSDEPPRTAQDTVSRAELDKVIRERQAAKDRARRAEEQLQTLRDEDGSRFGMSDDNAETDAPAGVVSDAAEAPAEMASARPNPSDLADRLHRREEQLADLVRDQQLREAAEAAGAVNPAQVVALLRTRVRMSAREDGAFEPVCLDEHGRAVSEALPNGVATLVDAFLADPANANLVRATARPGSGARPGGGWEPNAAPNSLNEFHALPPEQRRAAAMRMSRSQRQRLLGLGRPMGANYL